MERLRFIQFGKAKGNAVSNDVKTLNDIERHCNRWLVSIESPEIRVIRKLCPERKINAINGDEGFEGQMNS